jgi:hypothetical protein
MLLCDASHVTILHIHTLASCISFRYAELREELKDVMLELNPKTVFGGLIPKVEGLSKC